MHIEMIPVPTIRKTGDGDTEMIATPNTAIRGVTMEATIDSLVSANCLRRISDGEIPTLASSLCLPSQNSHVNELAKLKVGTRRPIVRRFSAGTTIGVIARKSMVMNPTLT